MNDEITNTPRTDDQFRDATKMGLDQKPARIPKQKKCTFCGGAGWWLDAMGTNSYRCDKCQNPEKADHIVDANKMVSTPRTDGEHADKLQRELAASKAEVERLKANLRRAIAIADVLRSGGSRACRELHHPKRDQHEYAEVCPVEERLEKASEELDGLKASLSSPSSL